MSDSGYREAYKELTSGDADRVLDALFVIGGRTDCPPPPEVVERCNQLMQHRDVDVRSRSIFAVGIHWAMPASFNALLGVALLDDAAEVRTAAVSALARYSDSKKVEVCRVLARVAAEADADPGLRGVAYIGLLRAEGRITVREEAGLSKEIGSLSVDEELLARWAMT